MDVGIVGLGRMGTSLASRARQHGHRVVGWDPDDQAREAAGRTAGVEHAGSLQTLAAALWSPRVVLMYVPHGAPVDANIDVLEPALAAGDVLVDAGNSHWQDSQRRRERLDEAGIHFLDVGTSGGTSDALGWAGAAFMVGGPREGFDAAEPVLRDLAVDTGAVHYLGAQPGVGHFAKLVHNAIEFGMIQSIAEGVELLARSDYDVDTAALFEHWNHGTVIRSWLIELMGHALAFEDDWDGLSTYVEDTGEVKWVLSWATDRDIPVPVVTAAQTALLQYRETDWPAAKAVALLRHQFGGHPVHREDEG